MNREEVSYILNLRGDLYRKVERMNKMLTTFDKKMVKVNRHLTIMSKGFNRISQNRINVTGNAEQKLKRIESRLRTVERQKKRINNIQLKDSNLGRARSGSVKTTGGIGGLGGLGAFLGAREVFQYGKESFNIAKELQSADIMLENITKSHQNYASSISNISALTRKYGADITETTKSYGKFFASSTQSGLGLKDTQKMYHTIIRTGTALGMSQENLGGTFLALEQMMNKGVVSMEELRRQLGERIPGGFAIAARSMGKTEAEFSKLVASGTVLTKDFLPNFIELLDEAYGNKAEATLNSYTAQVGRLGNAFTLLREKIGASIGETGLIEDLGQALYRINDLIDSDRFNKNVNKNDDSNVILGKNRSGTEKSIGSLIGNWYYVMKDYITDPLYNLTGIPDAIKNQQEQNNSQISTYNSQKENISKIIDSLNPELNKSITSEDVFNSMKKGTSLAFLEEAQELQNLKNKMLNPKNSLDFMEVRQSGKTLEQVDDLLVYYGNLLMELEKITYNPLEKKDTITEDGIIPPNGGSSSGGLSGVSSITARTPSTFNINITELIGIKTNEMKNISMTTIAEQSGEVVYTELERVLADLQITASNVR